MRTQIERILPAETIACEIMRLRSLFGFAASAQLVVGQHENGRFDLRLKRCQLLGQHYGVRVCNFTSSFCDGAMFCIIIHHYIPELLPLASIYRPRRMQAHDDLANVDETVMGDLVHLAAPLPDAVDAESEKCNLRQLGPSAATCACSMPPPLRCRPSSEATSPRRRLSSPSAGS
jgi:hypothetical protein